MTEPPRTADIEPTGGAMPDTRDTPWRTPIATGLGSMPGTDPREAARLVAGELPDLPHLVELPARGAGADMIGRTAAICIDMPAEDTPSGWRLARRSTRDSVRAKDYLSFDLDAAEQAFAGAPWVKIQAAGPWTLAAALETPNGNRALLDAGAVRDLTQSLLEGLAVQLADLAKRLDGTRFVVQIDEPTLPAVLAGTLTTASGFGRVPAVPGAEAERLLSDVAAGLAGVPTVLHCCHPDAPVTVLRRCGFTAVAVDLTAADAFDAARLDAFGEAIEDGSTIGAGLVPTAERAEAFDFRDALSPLESLLDRLGMPAGRLAQFFVTPTCGLATARPDWARRALAIARDGARALAER